MQKSQLIFHIICRFQESRVSIYNKVFCLIVKTGRFFSLHTTLFPRRFSPIPPDFNVNPRHYVNNTDTFIHRQNSLPFTLAGLFTFSLPPLHSSLSPLPWPFPDRPTANVHQMPPPPTSHPQLHPIPAACHCSPLCSIQTDGIAISTGFSLPVSASVSHTPHCLFCLPFSYPLPSEK